MDQRYTDNSLVADCDFFPENVARSYVSSYNSEFMTDDFNLNRCIYDTFHELYDITDPFNENSDICDWKNAVSPDKNITYPNRINDISLTVTRSLIQTIYNMGPFHNVMFYIADLQKKLNNDGILSSEGCLFPITYDGCVVGSEFIDLVSENGDSTHLLILKKIEYDELYNTVLKDITTIRTIGENNHTLVYIIRHKHKLTSEGYEYKYNILIGDIKKINHVIPVSMGKSFNSPLQQEISCESIENDIGFQNTRTNFDSILFLKTGLMDAIDTACTYESENIDKSYVNSLNIDMKIVEYLKNNFAVRFCEDNVYNSFSLVNKKRYNDAHGGVKPVGDMVINEQMILKFVNNTSSRKCNREITLWNDPNYIKYQYNHTNLPVLVVTFNYSSNFLIYANYACS